MPRRRLNPADRVLRARLRETLRFPDLTERREAPLIIAGAVLKPGDPPGSQPAVAVELTLAQHAEPS